MDKHLLYEKEGFIKEVKCELKIELALKKGVKKSIMEKNLAQRLIFYAPLQLLGEMTD